MRIRVLILFLFFSIARIHSTTAQQDPVDLYTSHLFGTPGDIVLIEIRVSNFTDILSFQASLNWNPASIKFIGVSDFGIKDFGVNDFGIVNAGLGHVRFLWDPNDATAVSAADSTVLFTAQFEIITSSPQTVSIDFIDKISTPAYPVEFANSKYEVLAVTQHEGSIRVVAELNDLVNLVSTANSSCDEKKPNGSLKANINGDSVNYSFHWFIGNSTTSTPDHIGYKYDEIPSGDYTLQIFDENNMLFIESISTKVLDESNPDPDVISVISSSSQTSCSTSPENQTGTIEINVNDAQPENTFQISWWKDNFEDGIELTELQDVYKAEKLYAGNYEVAVDNLSTGCTTYLKETVNEEKEELQLTLSSTENNFCKDGANGSASVSIANSVNLDPRYYWFREGDEIDTAQARFKGSDYQNISHGIYTAWVVDLNSDCFKSENIVVEQNAIYSEAIITQRNDTLFANDAKAEWFRNDVNLESSGLFFVPEFAGNYTFSIINEYGCSSSSDGLFFGITGLEETDPDISIFPNPFHEFIRVTNGSGKLDFVKVFDTNGALIREDYSIKNRFIDLHLNGSYNGIYLVHVSKNGKLFTWKTVKILPK